MALHPFAAACFCRLSWEQGESSPLCIRRRSRCAAAVGAAEIDWESLRGQDWLQKIKDFWQGGAAELLERLQKLISSQLVPPEELPPETIGESGAGGPLPAYSLSAYGLPAAEGTTLAPYFLTASMWSPVSGLVTSRFGWRSHPVSGQEDFHTGVDIAAAQGTPILAVLGVAADWPLRTRTLTTRAPPTTTAVTFWPRKGSSLRAATGLPWWAAPASPPGRICTLRWRSRALRPTHCRRWR